MTFDEIIARLNETTGKGFHIFAEYDDGRRGYFFSRDSYGEAKALASSLQLIDPVIYDKDGVEAVEPKFKVARAEAMLALYESFYRGPDDDGSAQ